jgi:hypothetical protein
MNPPNRASRLRQVECVREIPTKDYISSDGGLIKGNTLHPHPA